jgi:hypothetical protein
LQYPGGITGAYTIPGVTFFQCKWNNHPSIC